MRIPENIEERVREAYRGVVARDGDRVSNALRGLNKDQSRKAVALAYFVCGYIVKDIFIEEPTYEDLCEMAEDIVKDESNWINLGDKETVAVFLRAAAAGDTSFTGLKPEDFVGFTFVCGGHLLATYRGEGQQWWEYLDEIWAAVESLPEPS